MAADELRTDPFTWALAKHHTQTVAPRIQRARRRRLVARLSIAAVFAAMGSWFVVSSLGAQAAPAVTYEAGADGSGVISVSGDASEREVIDGLREILDDNERDIGVMTLGARSAVAGRLLPEGNDKMHLLDGNFWYDNTGTSILLESGATGSIVVTIAATDGIEQSIGGHDLRCEVHNKTIAEARAIAADAGYGFRVASGEPDYDDNTRVVDGQTGGGELIVFIGSPFAGHENCDPRTGTPHS
ncbi:MAG: hypothetical protein GY708_02240 [Actinomycetia bacterium]|nr:hypothetical protein [Actinomycetes bacterium]